MIGLADDALDENAGSLVEGHARRTSDPLAGPSEPSECIAIAEIRRPWSARGFWPARDRIRKLGPLAYG